MISFAIAYSAISSVFWIFTILPSLENKGEGTEENQIPNIQSISPHVIHIGDSFIVQGNNFSGFEGDLTIWIENKEGTKGILYASSVSDSTTMHFILPPKACQTDESYSGNDCTSFIKFSPGEYTIFTNPWGQKSNRVPVEIQ